MKKILLLFFLLSVSSLPVCSQMMERLFMAAPDSVVPLLDENDRFELVEYAKAGMKSRVSNRLEDESVLKEIGTDYLFLQTTGISSMQMKLLPVGSDTVICVVNSVKVEAEDSRVAFFDSKWNRFPGDRLFKSPSIREFFQPSDTVGQYVDMCDIYLVSLRLNANDNTLVAEYTMPDYMGAEDAALVRPLLRKLVYRWDGTRFVIGD